MRQFKTLPIGIKLMIIRDRVLESMLWAVIAIYIIGCMYFVGYMAFSDAITLCWYSDTQCLESIGWED